jgi:hypothetical protein
MAQESISEAKPPYISFVTFKNFLEGLKKAVIPARIDKGLMSGMSGGTQSYLFGTLKYLKLIHADFTPSADLRDFVNGDQATWEKVTRRSYGFIFESDIDLLTGTELQILELFGQQGLSGDTRRKSLSFFVALCEMAGIEIGPHIKGRTRNPGNSVARRKVRKRRNNDQGDGANSEGIAAPNATLISGHSEAFLPLTPDCSRVVKLIAPATITAAELKRIQGWLALQLIVEEDVLL